MQQYKIQNTKITSLKIIKNKILKQAEANRQTNKTQYTMHINTITNRIIKTNNKHDKNIKNPIIQKHTRITTIYILIIIHQKLKKTKLTDINK